MFDRFRSLTPPRQIWVIAAAATAIAVLLLVIWLVWLRTSYVPLFTNLRAGDAATIVAELDRRKVAYRLAEGGTSILVPEDDADGARLNVLTGDLPLKGAVGFELFNKSDMGLSDFAQRINYQRALQGELARTIMSLDGVETARIHLSLGEDRIFRDDRIPPKASVTIRMKARVRLSVRAAQGIQRLVAAAVPKLDIANVVVLDEGGQVVAAPPPVATHAPAAPVSPAKQKLLAIEQYYVARVREALETAYPADDIGVRVAARLPMEGLVGSQASVGLANWNPNTRDFPLLVTISTTVAPDAATQASLRGAVATALGTSQPADAVSFSLLPATQAVASSVMPTRVAGTGVVRTTPVTLPMPEVEFDWFTQVGLSLLVLLAMLGGFFMVARQGRRGRTLTNRQRSDFAARLRAALTTGGEGAESRS